MNAHEEVERQLAESVAARARSRRALVSTGLGRWWRERLGGASLALAALAALALAAGVPPSHRAGPVDPADRVLADLSLPGAREAPCPPCRSVGGRLHAPLSAQPGAVETRASGVGEVVVRRGLPAVVWAAGAGG